MRTVGLWFEELGIQASFHSQYNQAYELFRLAGSYKWKSVQFAGSFNDSHQDIGALFRIGFAQAGIILNHEKFRNVLGRSDELNTYYFQLTLTDLTTVAKSASGTPK